MVKYENGKIYRIVNSVTQEEYIGSTTKKYLAQRLGEHRADSKRTNSNRVLHNSMREHGTENFEIFLLEVFPCKSKDELLAREKHYIDLRNPIMNMKRKLLRTKEEELQYYKDYSKTEKRKETNKKYKEKNKETINEKKRLRYENNKEKIKEQKRIMYENNKDEINAKRREIYDNKKKLNLT